MSLQTRHTPSVRGRQTQTAGHHPYRPPGVWSLRDEVRASSEDGTEVSDRTVAVVIMLMRRFPFGRRVGQHRRARRH
jgi:hypothetical protein